MAQIALLFGHPCSVWRGVSVSSCWLRHAPAVPLLPRIDDPRDGTPTMAAPGPLKIRAPEIAGQRSFPTGRPVAQRASSGI